MAQGVGNLSIGTGIGDAQVFNPHPAIQQYSDILADKKAKHEAEVKMLGQELAKGYDPSVLRNDADRQSYLKQYGDIKDQAIKAENEKDANKKALALAGVRQQLTNLGSFAEGSKKQGALERQLAMAHLQNRFLFDDTSAQRLKDGMQKVWNDDSVVKDPSQLERGVDPAKIDAEYEKHKNTILKGSNATYDNGTLSPVQNLLGKKTATLTQNRIVPYQEAYEHTLNYATSDNDYQKYLHDKYPDVKSDNPKAELALRVKADMEARGDDRGFYDKPKVKEIEAYKPEDDHFYEHYNYELAHPKPNSTNTPNATAIIAENMRTSGDPSKFVPLIKNTLPKENYAKGEDVQVTTDVDPTTGQTVHVFKFPDKVKSDPKELQANQSSKARYSNHPEKEGSTLGFGGTPIPYEKSKQYQKDIANGRFFPNPVKVLKDNSQPYKIPVGDAQAYGVGVATMLKEQGASDATIQHILGRTGVNPVKLGDKPKGTSKSPDKKADPLGLGL